MSQVKRLIEKQEAQYDAAISIAVAGRSLKRCEWHPDIVMDAGEVDHSYAYRVGNAKLNAGELGDLFDSPRDRRSEGGDRRARTRLLPAVRQTTRRLSSERRYPG